MKIKQLEIFNMHRCDHKVYDFKDLNYLEGENGAGKSTVLQAIQLGILGYIPGQNKTNAAIFMHASGPSMSIKVTLSDGNSSDVVITRTFNKVRNSVSSSVTIVPAGTDIQNLISDIELPVFNFSDFVSQTPNTLKKWFQAFLPASSSEVDVIKEIKDCTSEISGDYSELISDVENYYKNISSSDIVERISTLHEYIKSLAALKKKQIADNESTISNLVYYDDFQDTMTEEDRQSEIATLEDSIRYIRTTAATMSRNAEIREQLKQFSSLADDIQSDDMLAEKVDALHTKQNEFGDIAVKKSSVTSEIAELAAELKVKQSIIDSGGICPYTKSSCDSIVTLIEDMKSECDDAESRIKELRELESKYVLDSQHILSDIRNLESFISSRKASYQSRDILKGQLVDEPKTFVSDPDAEIADRQSKIKKLRDDSIKHAANENYNKLIDSLTKMKYKLELEQSVLKLWIEKTGPNGLQNDLMCDPLEGFEITFNQYLKKVFNEDITCGFNTSSKSNTFSFGIKRGEVYIPYNNLSSGEKCMYIIALMSCIVDNAENPLKTVIVDDMFDHLDDKNFSYLLDGVSSIKGCQYIFAGVKHPNSEKPHIINP